MLPQPRPNDALRGSLARNEGKLALPPKLAGLDWFWGAQNTSAPTSSQEHTMSTITFTKTAPPDWLLAMWKEIDEKTFGKGFDCFAENAVCNLGVADWHGRERIRENLRAFVDKGFTAHHDVVEYWDSPYLKVFHGKVGMKFNDPALKPVRPTMVHFFYMDKADPSKVCH